MKVLLNYVGGIVWALIFMQCNTSQKSTGNDEHTSNSQNIIIPKGEAKSFQKELAGTWSVLSMRRQQKAELETLNNVLLTFDSTDSKFSGKAPCNSIFGNIQLNGYSIRFQNIGSTKMACDRLEQETAYIHLLQTRISTFTIDGNKLYFRDGASNIVFECERAM